MIAFHVILAKRIAEPGPCCGQIILDLLGKLRIAGMAWVVCLTAMKVEKGLLVSLLVCVVHMASLALGPRNNCCTLKVGGGSRDTVDASSLCIDKLTHLAHHVIRRG
jgi:hypothetical protein